MSYTIQINNRPDPNFPPVEEFEDAITSFTEAARKFPQGVVTLRNGKGKVIGRYPDPRKDDEESDEEEDED